jgi:hypothetical protein
VSLKPANKGHTPRTSDPFTTTTLDTFIRANENPLSNGGKWEKVKMASEETGALRVLSEHLQAEAGGGNYFWNVKEYKNPQANAEVTAYPGGANTASLFICCEKPTAEKVKVGYSMQIKGEGAEAEHLVEVNLYKWTAEVRSTLATIKGILVNKGDFIRVSAHGGKVQAWVKHGSGAWEVVLEAADSSYTNGYVGVGCGGTNLHLNNFAAGEFEAGAFWEPVTVEPGVPGAYTSRTINTTYTVPNETTNVYISIKGKAEATAYNILVDGVVVYKIEAETLTAAGEDFTHHIQVKAEGTWEVKKVEGTLTSINSVYQRSR